MNVNLVSLRVKETLCSYFLHTTRDRYGFHDTTAERLRPYTGNSIIIPFIFQRRGDYVRSTFRIGILFYTRNLDSRIPSNPIGKVTKDKRIPTNFPSLRSDRHVAGNGFYSQGIFTECTIEEFLRHRIQFLASHGDGDVSYA